MRTPTAPFTPGTVALAVAVLTLQVGDTLWWGMPTIAWIPQGWATGPSLALLAIVARQLADADTAPIRTAVGAGLAALAALGLATGANPDVYIGQLLAAATEEAVFRVAVPIVAVALLRLPAHTAAALSIVTFTAQPGHLAQGPEALAVISLLGGLLLWSIWRAGSIWPAVWAHLAFNQAAETATVTADRPIPAVAVPLAAVTMLVVLVAATDQQTRPTTCEEPA